MHWTKTRQAGREKKVSLQPGLVGEPQGLERVTSAMHCKERGNKQVGKEKREHAFSNNFRSYSSKQKSLSSLPVFIPDLGQG